MQFAQLNEDFILTLELPKEINSKIGDIDTYLPVAKASIAKTCTLVVAARIRSENIVVQPTEAFVFSKSYGKESKLKIDFPAGAVEAQCCLKVQVCKLRIALLITNFYKKYRVQLSCVVFPGQWLRDILSKRFTHAQQSCVRVIIVTVLC